MADDQSTSRVSSVSRRRFVEAAGATGTALSLAGCTSSDGGNSTATTTSSGDGGGKTTVQLASDADLKEVQSKFNSWLHEAGLSKDVHVEVIAGSDITNKRQNKYTQWLSSGRNKPSLLMMDNGWTLPFIVRDQLLNLSEEIPDTASMVEDEYFSASVGTAKGPNDDLFAVPVYPDFPTMQYRKDLVQDAGYDTSGWATSSMTWKRFSKITADVKKQSDVDYGFTFQFKSYAGLSCCTFNEFLSSYGGTYFGGLDNLFGPVGERPVTVDEKPVVDSLRMLRTFVNGESDEHGLDGVTGNISPQAVLQWAEEPSRKPFTNGNAVMHRNWPYAVNISGAEDALGKDLGVMPIPHGVSPDEAKYEGTGGATAALGGWHTAVNPNTNKKEAALEVVKAMTNKQVQFNLLEEIGWMPPRPSMMDSDTAKNIPVMGRHMETFRLAGENAIPRPVTVAWPQERSKIAQEANATVAGQKPPKKAMTDLKSTIKQIEDSV
ncbi:extracellular solute-binding protein [Halorussus aquaticus]|uniref:Extracellular solute-binding protein n=1 Tax=Halorussus aquaticus TaxID=2953748 RepID=A0ABD5Q0U2_9EURY|nr:extracellular solute-binding protein [Halorussus aquaticus]